MKRIFPYILLVFATLILPAGCASSSKTLSGKASVSVAADTSHSSAPTVCGLDTVGVPWHFLDGNSVHLLKGAQMKFDDLFACIDTARHSIHLEYFNFRNDSINAALMTRLVKKVHEGVEVRILFDDWGNISNNKPLKKEHLEDIRAHGIEIHPFDPMRFPWLNHAFHRDHRKVAVIDGKTGFVGGINVADYYIQGLPGIGPWCDMHVRFEGPAVDVVQQHFLEIWKDETDKYLAPDQYCFAGGVEKGDASIAIINDHPCKHGKFILDAYIWLINQAKETIRIITPYFMPPKRLNRALTDAVDRGVDVQLMVSTKGDVPMMPEGSLQKAYNLMKKGIRVYMFDGGFHHSKVMTVDGKYSMMGSCNLDSRGLFYDHELNALIVDRQFTRDMMNLFEFDRNYLSRTLTRSLWKERSGWSRFVGKFACFLGPLL